MRKEERLVGYTNRNSNADNDENDNEDKEDEKVGMSVAARSVTEVDDDGEFHQDYPSSNNLQLVSCSDYSLLTNNRFRTDWMSCLGLLALDLGKNLLLPYLWTVSHRHSLFGQRHGNQDDASNYADDKSSSDEHSSPDDASDDASDDATEDIIDKHDQEYYGAVGLKNYGETCFLNAVLQALASFVHGDDFSLFLLTSDATIPTTTCVNNRNDLLVGPALYDILYRVNHRRRDDIQYSDDVDPRWLLKSCQWSCYQAQDAHELFLFLMELLMSSPPSSFASSNPRISSMHHHSHHSSYHHHQEWEEKKHSDAIFDTHTNNTNTNNSHSNQHHDNSRDCISRAEEKMTPFTGKWKTTLICTACNHVRTLPMEESFVQLSLPIIADTNNYNKTTSTITSTTLNTCLEHVINEQERIPQVECYQCEYKRQLQHYEQEKQLYEQALKRLKQQNNHLHQPNPLTDVTKTHISNNKTSNNVGNHDGNYDYCEMNQEYQKILSRWKYYKNRLSKQDNKGTMQDGDIDDVDLKPKYKDAWKCVQMTHVPHLLCLHIKRLVGVHQPKISTHVEFPFILTFASKQFQCVSVIEHLGTSQRGHYVNYRQLHTTNRSIGTNDNINYDDRDNTKWARISDDKIIQPISWNQVAQCEAYMIFYKQIII